MEWKWFTESGDSYTLRKLIKKRKSTRLLRRFYESVRSAETAGENDPGAKRLSTKLPYHFSILGSIGILTEHEQVNILIRSANR
jgi:hypothetical protein